MRRRIGFLFICSAAIPIAVFAATAWGCGSLTTLQSSPKAAAPGATINVTGRNFSTSTSFSPVQIRWNSRTGQIIKEVALTTASGGAFSENVQIPAGIAPGWYVVNATQYNLTNGTPKSGSPARTTVRVQGSGASSAAPWGAAKPTGTSGPGTPDLPLPGIILSVALLATGLALVARDRGKKVSRTALGV
jgi:hypothetical protein